MPPLKATGMPTQPDTDKKNKKASDHQTIKHYNNSQLSTTQKITIHTHQHHHFPLPAAFTTATAQGNRQKKPARGPACKKCPAPRPDRKKSVPCLRISHDRVPFTHQPWSQTENLFRTQIEMICSTRSKRGNSRERVDHRAKEKRHSPLRMSEAKKERGK